MPRRHALPRHHRPAGRLSTRLQPNHPTDDPTGIAASMLDGLLYGCGDAVIGINPATDSVPAVSALLRMLDDVIHTLRDPDAVLRAGPRHDDDRGDRARRAGRPGVPVDRRHRGGEPQLSASTSRLLARGRAAALALKRGTVGDNVMYFETGQGSALSANAHHGVDQQTCEARAYAVARHFQPLLVNTVVGFIGPEYLYDGKQIIRAGLEDHFCGKLLGLPMGCDVCYTNHAEADQDDMDTLLTLLGAAGCNFIMGVPGADDVMLNYQTHLVPRRALRAPGARPAPGARVRGVAGARRRLRGRGPHSPARIAVVGVRPALARIA